MVENSQGPHFCLLSMMDVSVETLTQVLMDPVCGELVGLIC